MVAIAPGSDSSESRTVHPPTARQMAAVRAVMQLFIEEDLESGVSPHRVMRCARCAQLRPLPGFLLYDGVRFCNGCATEYELARISGAAHTASDFLRGAVATG